MKLTIVLNYDKLSDMPDIRLGGKLLGGQVESMAGNDAITSANELREFVQRVANGGFDGAIAPSGFAKRVIDETNAQEAKDND